MVEKERKGKRDKNRKMHATYDGEQLMIESAVVRLNDQRRALITSVDMNAGVKIILSYAFCLF